MSSFLALLLPAKTEAKVLLAAWAFCVAGLVFTAILQLADEVQAHREQEGLEAKESDLENSKSSKAIADSGSDRNSGSEKDSGSDKDSDCEKGFQTSEGEKALLSRNSSVASTKTNTGTCPNYPIFWDRGYHSC
jgi:hypothetical protein